MVGVIILLALFILLIVLGIGGVIWIFVDQHLSTKRYIKWLNRVEEVNKDIKKYLKEN